MGIDVRIHLQQIGDIGDLGFNGDYDIKPISEYDKEDHPEATHSIQSMCRYYGPHYERGNWPTICGVLMKLHAHEGVGKVWYGGDSTCQIPECPPTKVVAISLHYMEHGHRPYADAFKNLGRK